MSEIFHSLFTLIYNNRDIETSYQLFLSKNLRKRNIIYILITLTIIVLSTTLLWLMPRQKSNILLFKILGLVVLGTTFIILILSSACSNLKVTKIISYINFYLLIYSEVLLRSLLLYLDADVAIISLLYCIQYLYILTWYYTCTIDFLPGCLITVAKCISYYVVFGPNASSLAVHFRFSVNEITMIIVCMFSYFYVYEKRKSFYYYKLAENDRHWYHNILENMNTGFISLTGEEGIKYINKSLQMHLDNILKENKIMAFETESLNENSARIKIEALFRCQQFVNGFSLDDLSSPFNKIKQYLKLSSFDKFVIIGTNSIHTDNINLHFEVFGRYYNIYRNHGVIKSYEFIFNDITRVKNNEEINAEFKFKSMFLAKVAHEFKNPILCITELADQIGEKIEPILTTNNSQIDSFNSIREILINIKSMSDYLLFLIKDMDFFSIKNNRTEKALSVDKEHVNMNNLINFLKNITNILLRKFNKENNITFSIDHTLLPDEIYTDEIKLKQILINLISNAVKYTISGSINLELEYIHGKLNFTVRDTGRGISITQRSLLFKPYMEQNKDYNHIGAGLGLSIVKELVELLGGQIEYQANLPEGSRFSFSIDVKQHPAAFTSGMTQYNKISDDNVANHTQHDVETVKLDYYPTINYYKSIMGSSYGRKSSGLNSSDSAIRYLPRQYNVLIVDDEVITRMSTIRLIDKFCNTYSINVNFIEANDGIECLYNYYECLRSGKKISLIISDQYMDYMNGTYCAKTIFEITRSKNVTPVPFFLVTAFESFVNEVDSGIDGIYTKPLTKKNLEDMFLKTNLLEIII
jgi:signal transduction histidine kinase/CheY-like chemotaxis protein